MIQYNVGRYKVGQWAQSLFLVITCLPNPSESVGLSFSIHPGENNRCWRQLQFPSHARQNTQNMKQAVLAGNRGNEMKARESCQQLVPLSLSLCSSLPYSRDTT